jgi:hypothetical protein
MFDENSSRFVYVRAAAADRFFQQADPEPACFSRAKVAPFAAGLKEPLSWAGESAYGACSQIKSED